MDSEKPSNMVAEAELGGYQRGMSDELSWWKQPNLRRLYLMLPFLFLGSTTLGYDGSLLNGLQSMETWQDCEFPYSFTLRTRLTTTTVFKHPVGSTLGIYGAMPGFGGLAVLPFAPYIADNLGRRNGTAIGCLFVLLGALLQSFSSASNPQPMYLAGRFFIGFGGNLSNGTCPLLITEVSHPRHRGRTTTIYNTLWYLVRHLFRLYGTQLS